MERCHENPQPPCRSVRPFESFQAGERHRSPVRVLTQATIQAFAEVTGDRNPVHLDPGFARATIFRGTIAHGMLLNSLLAGMAFEAGLMGPNFLALESTEARFLAAVRAGDQIFGTVTIADVDPEASRRCGRVRWELRMFRLTPQDEPELAVEARWSTLVFKAQYLRQGTQRAVE